MGENKKMKPRERVYICSPYSGNIQSNEVKARLYCRLAYDKGYMPIAPHLYFPQFLDDSNKTERKAGTQFALELLTQTKELWVFGIKISKGMQGEIDWAKELKILIRYYTSDMEEMK